MKFAPKQGPIDALRDMRLDMLVAWFYLIPLAYAVTEGMETVVLSIAVSVLFTMYLVALQMWMPI